MPAQKEWEFRSEKCRICGGTNFKVLGLRGGEAHRDGLGVTCRIVKCNTCKTIFPDPMPYPKGEDLRYTNAENYFEEVMRVSHEGRLADGIKLLEEAEGISGTRGTFLDVGCGRGEIVKAATILGWDAMGCDISTEYVEYARRVNGVNALAGSIEELGFESNTFDFISLIEVIEHLYNPLSMIKELHRIIKPDGLLYISTPNEESIYQSLGNLYFKLRRKNWVVNLCPTWNLYHVLGFSPRSLKYLLERNGFSVERVVVYPGSLVVPRKKSIWGKIEGAGVDLVENIANFMDKSPYMYVWTRRLN